jgi:Mrp family chromosome partitioning ATPase
LSVAEPTDTEQAPAGATPAERMSLYYAALRRHWRLAAGIVAICALAGLAVAALGSKSYDATAKVLIGQRAQVDSLLGTAAYTPDPERDVNTSLELVKLEPVAEGARRRLGSGTPAAVLVGKVGAAVDSNSNVVSITATDASARQAARIANAFALAYRDFRTSSARASIEDAITGAEERAAGLPPGPELDALQAQLEQLRAAAALQTGGVQVVRPATASSAEPSGSPLKSGILAGLLGAILAGAAVIVLARTDKRVRSEGELEDIVGAPVLATVPTAQHPAARADARDSLATLALSLSLRGVPGGKGGGGRRDGSAAQVLLLTSPGPSEGTSAVALGLAQALGQMGRRVIAIEADFRQPTFARQLGVGGTRGLAAVLIGSRTLDEVCVEVEPMAGGEHPVVALPAASRPLPHDALPPQPILAGPAMAQVVAKARRMADVVLLAGAPAATFGDSFALVPLADATLLVACLDVTTRDETDRVARALRQLGAPPRGVVATTGGAVAGTTWTARSTTPRPTIRSKSLEKPDSSSAKANGSAGGRRRSGATR